jgi:hypothetical protein
MKLLIVLQPFLRIFSPRYHLHKHKISTVRIILFNKFFFGSFNSISKNISGIKDVKQRSESLYETHHTLYRYLPLIVVALPGRQRAA